MRTIQVLQVSTHVEYLMDPYGSLWSFVPGVPGKFVWVIQMIQAPHTAPTWSWRVLVPWSPSIIHRPTSLPTTTWCEPLNAERIQTWTDQFTHFTQYQHVEHRLSTSWCGDPPRLLAELPPIMHIDGISWVDSSISAYQTITCFWPWGGGIKK